MSEQENIAGEHEQTARKGLQGRKRGPKPGTEAARRGGRAVSARYGHDFYARIGKKGGETVRREHGPDFYVQIGKKGGDSTKRNQGSEFYARIGKKGGQANRKLTPGSDV